MWCGQLWEWSPACLFWEQGSELCLLEPGKLEVTVWGQEGGEHHTRTGKGHQGLWGQRLALSAAAPECLGPEAYTACSFLSRPQGDSLLADRLGVWGGITHAPVVVPLQAAGDE